ncbi:hypothetical protein ACJX0J_028832, partial [Zea mays]
YLTVRHGALLLFFVLLLSALLTLDVTTNKLFSLFARRYVYILKKQICRIIVTTKFGQGINTFTL